MTSSIVKALTGDEKVMDLGSCLVALGVVREARSMKFTDAVATVLITNANTRISTASSGAVATGAPQVNLSSAQNLRIFQDVCMDLCNSDGYATLAVLMSEFWRRRGDAAKNFMTTPDAARVSAKQQRLADGLSVSQIAFYMVRGLISIGWHCDLADQKTKPGQITPTFPMPFDPNITEEHFSVVRKAISAGVRPSTALVKDFPQGSFEGIARSKAFSGGLVDA